MSRRTERSASDLPNPGSQLWVVGILFFGIGDILTTGVGLSLEGIREVGPITGSLVGQYGRGVMVPMKLLTFGGCYLLWRFLPEPHRLGVPLGLALLGVWVTTWNLMVVATVAVF